MSAIVFDIETGPLPLVEVANLMPTFEAPSNWKDPEKIRTYVATKEADWYKKAALSATSGRVLAIGWATEEGESFSFASGDEAHDIACFWGLLTRKGAFTNRLIGFNSNAFDLPFLIRRSWKHGMHPPIELMNGRYLNRQCIDLLDLWRCGNREDRIKLDTLAHYLGVGAKNGNGADFATLWHSDREAALRYLDNDIQLTRRCAQALGAL